MMLLSPTHFSGVFGDDRLAKRGHCILSNGLSHKSIRVHTSGGGKGAYRFYDNTKVTVHGILAAHYRACRQRLLENLADSSSAEPVVGLPHRYVYQICDGTSFDFSHMAATISIQDDWVGRIDQRTAGLGILSHVGLMFSEQGGLMGLSSAAMWSRPYGGADKKARKYAGLETKDKESQHWVDDIIRARDWQAALPADYKVCTVMDREGDDYAVLSQAVCQGTALVVRMCRDRRVLNGPATKIQACVSAEPPAALYQLWIPRTSKHTAHQATMELRYCPVTIPLPKKKHKTELAKQLTIWVVQAAEVASTVPPGEKPVNWTILTTETIETTEAASWVVKTYQGRWRIEDYFSAVKTRGMEVESSQLRTGAGLQKQTAMALQGGVLIQQLVEDRNGEIGRPATDVFDQERITYAEVLNEQLGGAKNPHLKGSLAYVAYVIARMGGWAGRYYKSSLPGRRTFAIGISRFEQGFFSFQLGQTYYNPARSEQDVGND